MRLTSAALAMVIVGCASLPGRAQAPASPFLGTWHLNVAQSKAAPGETPPKDLTARIERVDPAHLRWTTISVGPDGKQDVQTHDNPANGEYYSLNGYVMVAHRIGADSLESTYRDSSGQTDVLRCTLAGDIRLMTCNGLVTHQDGSIVRYTDVFDRG